MLPEIDVIQPLTPLAQPQKHEQTHRNNEAEQQQQGHPKAESPSTMVATRLVALLAHVRCK
jgi:hypothetical protein